PAMLRFRNAVQTRPSGRQPHPLTVGLGFVAALLALPTTSAAADKASPTAVTFDKDVLPLFEAKCLRCHGGKDQKAGLDLRSKAGLLKGGESGPALQPGAADKSVLWEKLAADKMPPGKEKLSAAEKALIRAWIDQGARDNSPAAGRQSAGVPDQVS